MINGNETVRMSFPKEKLQDLLMGNIKLNNEKREVKGITEKGEYLNFDGEVDIKKAFLKWIYSKSKSFWIRFMDEEIHGSICSVFDNTANIAVTDEMTGEKDGQVLILLSYMKYFGVDIGWNV